MRRSRSTCSRATSSPRTTGAQSGRRRADADRRRGRAAGPVARDPRISRREISRNRRCCRPTCGRGRMRARSPRWWRWTRIRSSCRACANISRRSCASMRPTRVKWVRHWLDAGSRAVEQVLAKDPRTGRFCVGDQADHRGHLSRRAPDQPASCSAGASPRIFRPRAASTQLHGDRCLRGRAPAAPARRAEGRTSEPSLRRGRMAHARRASPRRRLSRAPGRRGRALRDRAHLQADGR